MVRQPLHVAVLACALAGCNEILQLDPVQVGSGGAGGGGGGGGTCEAGTPAADPVQVALGGGFGCAVAGSVFEGRLFCWGANDLAQLGHGPSGPPVGDEPCELGPALLPTEFLGRTPYRVAAGRSFACARVADSGPGSHEVRCWGEPGPWLGSSSLSQSMDFTGPLSAERVFAGTDHACVLSSAEQLRCWGRNGDGQLGIMGGDVGSSPSEIQGLQDLDLGDPSYRVVDAALGGAFSCAVVRLGDVGSNTEVWCWGANGTGQLTGAGVPGSGTNSPSAAGPIPLSSLQIQGLAAGDGHACAIDAARAVWCWGANSTQQAGAGGSMVAAMVKVSGGGLFPHAIAVAAGRAHSCAVFESTNSNPVKRVLRCWGDNQVGQLGNGSSSPSDFGLNPIAPPAQLPEGFVPDKVAAFGDATCAVSQGDPMTGAGQEVLCWGAGQFGRLGQGSLQNLGDSPGELEGTEPIALDW